MIFIKKKHIPRRTLLKGLGASLALPFLDSMIPALGGKAFAQAANQKNFLAFYFPFGVIPAGQSSNPYTLNQNLSPLQNLYNQNRVGILRNISHTGGDTHPAATFLTANYSNRSLRDIVRNESIDQRIAAAIAQSNQATPISSLVYGTRRSGRDDQPMRNYISFTGPGNPLPKEFSLQRAFDRLFSTEVENAQSIYRKKSNQSVLDAARESIKKFVKTLPASDREKMEAYLQSVESVEKQVSEEATSPTPPAGFGLPNVGNLSNIGNFQQKAQTQAELALIAMQTGLTQIATVMLDDAYNGTSGSLSFDGRTFHDSGRDGSMHFRMDSGSGLTYLRSVQNMLANVFRYTVEKSIEYGIFNDSAIIMGSECGKHHNPGNHVLLVGGGIMGARLGNDRTVNTHIGRLYVSIARAFGVNIDRFGEGNGGLSL